MKKAILFGLAFSTMAASTFANDFVVDVGASYLNQDETDAIGIDGIWYINGVDVGESPYFEAPFLDQASFVEGEFVSTDADGIDAITLSIGGRAVLPEDNWIIEGAYSYLEVDVPGDPSVDALYVGVGKYLNDTTTFIVSYSILDSDILDDDINTLAGEFRHFGRMGSGMGYAAEIFTSLSDDEADTVQLGGAYKIYPNKQFGIGLELAQAFTDPDDIVNYSLVADFFFTPNFYITADITDSDEDDSEVAWTIEGRLRF
ncbi:putative porin [Marinibactrum halimedae]|uniref:Porin n=1 Tax=Marinibactrum halimedae TaxID=1444977 RepID=A0AA37TC14_9GAMM|nr:putative porin [Marinibactrum halimedae]MCD9460177.1 putative porin [Marinibactrum halimedae]GLS26352.1 hypothetical protein GCM10007877_20670 [Marinibactrum halimedae]